ncbi:HAD family hydrolase [uncultured Streptococcus sp.]|uniref:HAD family hydrolase n=1 Tax=uncultured Streptococcus sp. TaxID=83427 RepID=UPI002598EC4A|nr:HAD family hydrolase [uncultured Streptococcus sp.]
MADLQYKNYIFDFYGTLVDIWTDEDDEKLWEQMAALYAAYGADYFAAELKANYDNHIKRQENQLRKRSQVTLKTLKEVGATVILLSNAQRAFTQAEIEMTGCREFLDKIYISSDYKMKKPQVEFVNLVLNDNQLNPEETVMVGNDFTSDMAIAQAAGIDGILLNTFPYNQSEIETLNTMNAKVIEDISELVG